MVPHKLIVTIRALDDGMWLSRHARPVEGFIFHAPALSLAFGGPRVARVNDLLSPVVHKFIFHVNFNY